MRLVSPHTEPWVLLTSSRPPVSTDEQLTVTNKKKRATRVCLGADLSVLEHSHIRRSANARNADAAVREIVGSLIGSSTFMTPTTGSAASISCHYRARHLVNFIVSKIWSLSSLRLPVIIYLRHQTLPLCLNRSILRLVSLHVVYCGQSRINHHIFVK